jgi:hypothetical protein
MHPYNYPAPRHARLLRIESPKIRHRQGRIIPAQAALKQAQAVLILAHGGTGHAQTRSGWHHKHSSAVVRSRADSVVVVFRFKAVGRGEEPADFVDGSTVPVSKARHAQQPMIHE